MSQEDLADYLETNQRQISYYETGRNDPTGNVLIKMAQALDTTTDWLLGLTDVAERPLESVDDLDTTERKIIAALRRGERMEAARIILNG